MCPYKAVSDCRLCRMWLLTYRCLIEELDWYADSARHFKLCEAGLFEGFEAMRLGIWTVRVVRKRSFESGATRIVSRSACSRCL
jgi:hypothetical protein